MMKTYQPKRSEVTRATHTIDAKGRILGRLSTEVAMILMGKNKPGYSRHMDVGDKVTVINAAKVKVTGKKEKQKVYISHSGYPGGYKEVKYEKLQKTRPEEIIRRAVKGMLPKNRLQSDRMARLTILKGEI